MGALVSKKVFQPPSPPTYACHGGEMMFIKKNRDSSPQLVSVSVSWLLSGVERIPAVFLENKAALFTILVAHSNAEDIGTACRYAAELGDELEVNVFCFDYTGYGLATGRPSEKACYDDILAAYKHLVDERGISPETIIVYGRSLGSGPAVELSSKVPVGGLVLISPFMSLLRIVKNVKYSTKFDMFRSVDKIAQVKCPILYVHGEQDTLVPVEHSYQLHKMSRTAVEPLYISDADHYNVEIHNKVLVFARVSEFLSTIRIDEKSFFETDCLTDNLTACTHSFGSNDSATPPGTFFSQMLETMKRERQEEMQKEECLYSRTGSGQLHRTPRAIPLILPYARKLSPAFDDSMESRLLKRASYIDEIGLSRIQKS